MLVDWNSVNKKVMDDHLKKMFNSATYLPEDFFYLSFT